jgi:hypothetical protein
MSGNVGVNTQRADVLQFPHLLSRIRRRQTVI